MDRANNEKGYDLEKLPAAISIDEARSLKQSTFDRPKKVEMQKFRHCLFALLAFALLAAGVVYAHPNHVRCSKAASTSASPEPTATEIISSKDFQELLNTVDPASLHEVLHNHLKDKYQHGVYREDKSAMEVVHQQDAEVAHSLIELARRQAGSTNGTSVVTTTPTSTVGVTKTEGSTSTVQPSSTATQSPTSATQQTSQASSQPSSTPSSTVATSTPASSDTKQGSSTSTAPAQTVSSTKNAVSDTTTTANPKTTTAGMSTNGYSFSSVTSTSASYLAQNWSSPSEPPSMYSPFEASGYTSSAGSTIRSLQVSSSMSSAAPTAYAPVQDPSAVSATPTVYSPIQSSDSLPAQSISSTFTTGNASLPKYIAVSAAPMQSPIQNYSSVSVALNSSSVVLPIVYAPVSNTTCVATGPVPPYVVHNSSCLTTSVSTVQAPFQNVSSSLVLLVLPTPNPFSFQNASSTSANCIISCSNFNSMSGSSTTTGASSGASSHSQGPSSSQVTSTSAGTSNTPVASTSEGASSAASQGSSSTASSITQKVVYKTTLANGAVSTVTSVTVVPGAAGDSNGGSSTSTNTANASLQTGAASQKSLAMNVVIGALGLGAVAVL